VFVELEQMEKRPKNVVSRKSTYVQYGERTDGGDTFSGRVQRGSCRRTDLVCKSGKKEEKARRQEKDLHRLLDPKSTL